MKFLSISNLLNTASFRDGNTDKMALYTSFVPTIVSDLQFAVLKDTVTEKYYIDKNTNSLAIPRRCQMLVSVGYQDSCGRLQPIYYNQRVPKEFIFQNAKQNDCDCQCGCNGVVKDRIDEVVKEKVDFGSGIVMEKTIHTFMDAKGNLIRKTLEPVAKEGLSGTEFEMIETSENLCSLEVKECGCIVDNEANASLLNEQVDSCIGTFNLQCGVDVCRSNNANGYSISLKDGLILLPKQYTQDHIVIKYFPTYETEEDYKIPELAREAFLMGLLYYTTRMDIKTMVASRQFRVEYTKELTILRNRINKVGLGDFLKILGYAS